MESAFMLSAIITLLPAFLFKNIQNSITNKEIPFGNQFKNLPLYQVIFSLT